MTRERTEIDVCVEQVNKHIVSMEGRTDSALDSRDKQLIADLNNWIVSVNSNRTKDGKFKFGFDTSSSVSKLLDFMSKNDDKLRDLLADINGISSDRGTAASPGIFRFTALEDESDTESEERTDAQKSAKTMLRLQQIILAMKPSNLRDIEQLTADSDVLKTMIPTDREIDQQSFNKIRYIAALNWVELRLRTLSPSAIVKSPSDMSPSIDISRFIVSNEHQDPTLTWEALTSVFGNEKQKQTFTQQMMSILSANPTDPELSEDWKEIGRLGLAIASLDVPPPPLISIANKSQVIADPLTSTVIPFSSEVVRIEEEELARVSAFQRQVSELLSTGDHTSAKEPAITVIRSSSLVEQKRYLSVNVPQFVLKLNEYGFIDKNQENYYTKQILELIEKSDAKLAGVLLSAFDEVNTLESTQVKAVNDHLNLARILTKIPLSPEIKASARQRLSQLNSIKGEPLSPVLDAPMGEAERALMQKKLKSIKERSGHAREQPVAGGEDPLNSSTTFIPLSSLTDISLQPTLEESLKMVDDINFTKKWVGKNIPDGPGGHMANGSGDENSYYMAFQEQCKRDAIALLQEQVRGTDILSRVERGSFTNSSGTDSEDGTLSDVSDAAVVSSVTDGDEMTGGSLADKAYEKIEQLERNIERLKGSILSGNSTPPVEKAPQKKWLSFNRNSSSKDVTLSPDEKKLAEMQLVLSQAYALLDNAIASDETSKVYSTSGTHVNVDSELLLLRNSYEGFQKIIEVIDVLGKSQKPLSSPSQANATMIEQRRGTSGTGQTRLVTNVDNRAVLAEDVMKTMALHNTARTAQNVPKKFVSDATIEGADPTSVRFRGVALAREKDIIQYTESLTSGSLIYSETSVNKDGCPVATDRTEIVPAYPSDEWKSDARQAAMIKAENILANYKGTGRIVLRTVQYSGNKEADHERINMEYAAILALSSKSIFSSYPKIVVDIEGFEPPKFSVIGSTANKFIEKHLGKPPHRFTQQANMAQELKALREKDPRVTHGVGINKDGKVVEPEKEIGVLNASNLARQEDKGQPFESISATDDNHDSVSMFSDDDSMFDEEEGVTPRTQH